MEDLSEDDPVSVPVAAVSAGGVQGPSVPACADLCDMRCAGGKSKAVSVRRLFSSADIFMLLYIYR